jgi:hypothetical protein
MDVPKYFVALSRRLDRQRLRVGDEHWIVTGTSVTDVGLLRIDFKGRTRRSVFVDMPPAFESRYPDHMAWLIGHIEFQLSFKPQMRM